VNKYVELVSALAEELDSVAQVLKSMGADEWWKPTLLDPIDSAPHWTVLELAGHLGYAMNMIDTLLSKESAPPSALDRVSFYDQPKGLLATMNTWEDGRIIHRISQIGKKRLVLAGLWTGVCIVGPALSALDQGFEVYFIADACGDVSSKAHDRAVERMVQAGAHPMTSIQYLLELQRDWARGETYDAVMNVAKLFGGRYGIGITYAKTMLGEHASEAGPAVQAV
jgi:isochorismatase family protein